MLRAILILVISVSFCVGQEKQKQNVAVLDFNVVAGLDNNTALTLTGIFRSTISQKKNFKKNHQLISRQDMVEILTEYNFKTNCTDISCAVESGKLLGADKITVGEFGKIGQKFVVTARVVDVGSAKIDNSASVEYRGGIEGLSEKMIELADKLYPDGISKWWYAVGGAVLAGGGYAAYVLLQPEEEEGPTFLPEPPKP